MSTDEAFEQDLGPNEWPCPNFDEAPTDAEWEALADLESAGAFAPWDDGGRSWG